MEVGIFTPIGNNGWLISENSPQYMPSFDLNKEIAQKAESYGVDFLVSMIKFCRQKTASEIGLGIPAEPLFRSYAPRLIIETAPVDPAEPDPGPTVPTWT